VTDSDLLAAAADIALSSLVLLLPLVASALLLLSARSQQPVGAVHSDAEDATVRIDTVALGLSSTAPSPACTSQSRHHVR